MYTEIILQKSELEAQNRLKKSWEQLHKEQEKLHKDQEKLLKDKEKFLKEKAKAKSEMARNQVRRKKYLKCYILTLNFNYYINNNSVDLYLKINNIQSFSIKNIVYFLGLALLNTIN